MKKTFLVTFDSDFDDIELVGLIDGSLSFYIEEGVDDMFRNEHGGKNYAKCDYEIVNIKDLAAWLNKENSVLYPLLDRFMRQ